MLIVGIISDQGEPALEKLIQVTLLSLGGVFGVNARYWLGVWVTRNVSHQFPLATFLINVSGSFAIGFLATLLSNWLPHPHFRLLVVTGFLGGYTTYSSFAFESLTLWERGEARLSIVYVLSTLLCGFVAVTLGVALARQGIAFESARGPAGPSARPALSAPRQSPDVDPDLEPRSRP
jgi:CrcB protein